MDSLPPVSADYRSPPNGGSRSRRVSREISNVGFAGLMDGTPNGRSRKASREIVTTAAAPGTLTSGSPLVRKSAAEEDQASVIKALCKTYAATTTKLMYAFAALSEQKEKSGEVKTLSDALSSAGRNDLLEQITLALASSVERVLRSGDLAMRSSVLRDLRARFSPKDKPAGVDAGVQVAVPALKSKKSKGDLELKPGTPDTVSCDEISLRSAKEENEDEGAKETTDAAVSKPSANMTVAIYERLKNWEAQKLAKLERERLRAVEKEAKELVPDKNTMRKSTARYSQVESAIKVERKAAEEQKLAEVGVKLHEEAEARIHAEMLLTHSESMREQLVQRLEQTNLEKEAVLEKLAAAQKQVAREQETVENLKSQYDRAAQQIEIKDSLAGKALEVWPMFPNKRVLRVAESEEFDGRISAEYRVKDMESNEKGVSLLMGRNAATKTSEPQCVLFDSAIMSDLEAARWWVANQHRFEKLNRRRAAFKQAA
uniref:Uncharacterized protein n=1 Tax=Chrysotila carterae TaxID=13221 RepID=A0A7S4BD06_CHRCT|mmetsp:Transcript_54826/g.119618  ORF Transcript_54826/g.119618 Transcript_54826/m.119618 type:complete len:487 (+) Transcript_54826:198-1658(+)